MEHPATDPHFEWEVNEDMIDLDEWANAIISVTARSLDRADRQIDPRYWAALAAVLISLGLLQGSWVSVAMIVPTIALIAGVLLWNRLQSRLLAKKLHGQPAASESFTFAAAPEGTRSHSASGSDTLSWSRYQAITTEADLLVLTLDNDTKRVLPQAALRPPHTHGEAITSISGWIEAANMAATTTSTPADE